jgi:hypothetical protein
MLRILVLSANPVDTQFLSVDQEFKRIHKSLSQRKDEIDLKYWPAASPQDFTETLEEHKPNILHFSGHSTSVGDLVFQGSNDKPVIPIDPVSEVIKILGGSLRCVVLNACYAETQAKAIVQKIDCMVVGMRDEVLDETAVRFSERFYFWIGNGKNMNEILTLTKFELGKSGYKIELEKSPIIDINEEYLLKSEKLRARTGISASLISSLEKVPREISLREFWEDKRYGELRQIIRNMLDKSEEYNLGDADKEQLGNIQVQVPLKLADINRLNMFSLDSNRNEIQRLQFDVLNLYHRAIEILKRLSL